jgi:hypothetical protein
MAYSRLLFARKEIQDYLRSCEHLLSAAVMADDVPFSAEEEEIVEYYAIELLKLFPRARPAQKYRQSIHEYARLSEALLYLNHLTLYEKELTQGMLKQLSEKLLSKPRGA